MKAKQASFSIRIPLEIEMQIIAFATMRRWSRAAAIRYLLEQALKEPQLSGCETTV